MDLKKLNAIINDNTFKNYKCCNEYEDDFDIDFTYNSDAIEGNKMTKEDIILLLEKKMIAKETSLNDILETINHIRVFKQVKDCARHGISLDENLVKDIHQQLMDNIMSGGIYRNHNVRITGAKHKPPTSECLYNQIKYFFSTLKDKEKEMDPIELAAYTHAEFVKIHPFSDGNGRTSRLIMNYQLIKNNYLPINITKESKSVYFDCLEEYANNNNLRPFKNLILHLEIQELEKCKKYQKGQEKVKK